MNVLMISGDTNLHELREGSAVNERVRLQRSQVERLDIFVWPQVHSRREILRAARREKYDVVTSQDPFWRGLLAWRAARLSGARLNVQIHTDISKVSPFRRVLARFILRRADSVRVVSEKIRNDLAPLTLRAHISVLPVFIDTASFVGLARRVHPYFKKVILWVGRFESEKNPEAALRVLENVRAAGIDAGLIMLGSGSLEAHLKRQAESLTQWVEFVGWDEPAEYLAMADVVVCTSLHESYGASIVEALAAGVPVVAPDVGIAREAGATVVERRGIAGAVIEALKTGQKGTLKLQLFSADQWAQKWKESL